MNAVVEQLSLPITRTPARVDVPVEMIYAKRNQGAAFTLACDASGLDDKEIYMAMNVDAGTFSRMKKGINTLSGDQMKEFCRIVGNTIYTEWLAYQVGCALVMLKSEAERRAEEAERRAMDAEEKLRFLTKVMQGKAA